MYVKITVFYDIRVKTLILHRYLEFTLMTEIYIQDVETSDLYKNSYLPSKNNVTERED